MSGLESLYQQTILEHSKARHGGTLSEVAACETAWPEGTGQCHQLNPVCGDEITLRLAVDGGAGDSRVASLEWLGNGCSISMASASMLTDLAEDLTVDELARLIEEFRAVLRSRGTLEGDPEELGDAAALSGVAKFPARVKCAMLAWVAAEDALRQAVSTAA
ncbi:MULTISPECIES: Fe-S cluster assembly sulfur transfer protein SufU [Arthrobacter]|uniref:Fe-S cluster assembly sulfur transfer protein SufU n=2 Tax=Arthrobacter TaxID=1663 RepID=A0ABU9KMI8_9MICC|nr:SUF system NifU family Fe-S cluster assembly protein [Arthrobacter sp. YJM1]MDP5227309.1 SUF system NifU family Fe-S cluster assembly protein [Arthrobacter sp. YJM1]